MWRASAFHHARDQLALFLSVALSPPRQLFPAKDEIDPMRIKPTVMDGVLCPGFFCHGWILFPRFLAPGIRTVHASSEVDRLLISSQAGFSLSPVSWGFLSSKSRHLKLSGWHSPALADSVVPPIFGSL